MYTVALALRLKNVGDQQFRQRIDSNRIELCHLVLIEAFVLYCIITFISCSLVLFSLLLLSRPLLSLVLAVWN